MENISENYKFTIMKELSIEEKAKRYDEAIKRASNLHKDAVEMENSMTTKTCEIIFPELKESGDEKVRKALVELVKYANGNCLELLHKPFNIVSMDAMISWLKKQGDYNRLIEEIKKRKELLSKEKEKATSANDKLSLGGRIAMLQELLAFNICNTTYKIEPKFKVGDWIVQEYIGVYKVIEICESWYEVVDNKDKHYSIDFDKEYMCHLWTINDAKDGDVLMTTNIRNCPFIYRKTDYNNNLSYYYAGVDGNGDFCEGCLKRTIYHFGSVTNITPATKEQRELLFSKMKEAGYEWDAEKRELKKIEVTRKEARNETIIF